MMYKGLIERARAAAPRAANGPFLTELVDALEDSENVRQMGVVEVCKKLHFQQCDECPDMGCCDNTSPAKKKIDETVAISEAYRKTARDLEQALDNVRGALGLESTHWMVIHNQVEDVIKERDRLRQELGEAADKTLTILAERDHLAAASEQVREDSQRMQQQLAAVTADRDRLSDEAVQVRASMDQYRGVVSLLNRQVREKEKEIERIKPKLEKTNHLADMFKAMLDGAEFSGEEPLVYISATSDFVNTAARLLKEL